MVREALPNMDTAGGSEPCGNGTCQVCDLIITTNTFTTKICGELFQIQSGPLFCNSEMVLYLLRCKICDDTPYVGKGKTKFRLRFNNYKSKHRSLRKRKQNIPRKRFHSHYIQDCHRAIDDWEVTLLRSVKRTNNLKKGRHFGNTK